MCPMHVTWSWQNFRSPACQVRMRHKMLKDAFCSKKECVQEEVTSLVRRGKRRLDTGSTCELWWKENQTVKGERREKRRTRV